MKYRIKVIEKNNGDKIYIPQCLGERWYVRLVLKIIFSPLVALYCLICSIKSFKNTLWYFDCWDDMEESFLKPYRFYDETNAREAIQEEIHKQSKKHGEKTNAIKYISVNDFN